MISNMTAHITVTVLIQFIFVVSIILSVIPAAKHHFWDLAEFLVAQVEKFVDSCKFAINVHY